MCRYCFFYITFIIYGLKALTAQTLYVKGQVIDAQTRLPVVRASIRIEQATAPHFTSSDPGGRFFMSLVERKNFRLSVTHLAYQAFTRDIRPTGEDTVYVTIELKQKNIQLESVNALATHQPETLVAKADYSIFDFDFHEDKLLLLSSARSMNKAQVQLSDYTGQIIASYALPQSAGMAKCFFHDYEGYTEVICKDSVFRLDVMNNELMVIPVLQRDFRRYIAPVADTINNNFYFDDHFDEYPRFNYFYIGRSDTASHLLSTVTNTALLDLYNFEYYFLPPQLQLEARRIEQYQKIDRHIAAALMSGFTRSLFYEPLYAPLFIINDTICIFNHHSDFLYHFNKNNKLIDSIRIAYHHPKNWKDWKRRLLLDETENKVYAFFSSNSHHYLKHIDHRSGKETGTYKLKNHSAENIKIRDGYVYYVYRPFGSTQEKFLYREKIE